MFFLKRCFGVPWVLAIFIACIHIAIQLVMHPNSLAWWSATLGVWPVLLFFLYTGLSGKGRSPTRMTLPLLAAVAGTVIIAVVDFDRLPFFYTVGLGIIGILLYDFWYSILPAPQNDRLSVGHTLPVFEVRDVSGAPVSSQRWLGQPLLLLFIRGNWCPLCVAQVKELAAEYQRLASKGVRIVVVSTQTLKETRQLAEKFSVPFEFYADSQATAVSTLGIRHALGSPPGLPSDSADTSIPTLVVCNAAGIIEYVDISVNYRDRPQPEKIFRELGI